MNHIKPPSTALRFLRWFCQSDLIEDVEGDLTEIYHQRIKNKKLLNARLRCWFDVLLMFRPGIIKSLEIRIENNQLDMFRNYLLSSWRNLMKHKRFSAINIFSLTIGIASCIIIYLFISDESSFDSFHSKRDNIYRLCEVQTFPGTNTQKVALTMPGMAPTMLEDFPEVEGFTRYWSWGKQSVDVDGKYFLIDNVVGVDSTFLSIFDYPLLSGDKLGLTSIYDVYVTESIANRLYGTNDVIGKKVKIDDDLLTIRGVLADVPENSHLQFDILASIYLKVDQRGDFDNAFGGNFINTYLLLRPGVDLEALQSKFPEYLIDRTGNDDIGDYYSLFLQSLTDVHLTSTDIEHDYNDYRKFNGAYLDVFLLIGIFILVIASVNFMNLTTARASNRAKEVGVRKTIGAKKEQLFAQFIVESILMSLIAFVLAIILDVLALPFLNRLVGRDLSIFQFLTSTSVFLSAFGITLFLGLLTGLYPSIYLSSFKPVMILKGLKNIEKRSVFRSSLIVLQFSLALAMIVCTLVVVQQLMFMKNKDLGYNTEYILLVGLKNQARENYPKIKEKLKTYSNIQGVTASGQRIGNNFHQWGFKAEVDTGIINFTPSNVSVDFDFLEVYGIEVKRGRSFSKEYAKDDGLSFIVNEALAKEIGSENPVGHRAGHDWYPNDSLGTIIGVTEDFNFNSLHYKVNTLSMVIHSEWGFSEMSVKLNGQNLQEGIRQVEEVYNEFVTDYPFEYEFLDKHFDELYESDQQLGSVITIIAILSILIGCMGLFGLASISIERRIKEIGIRKVMGASVSDLVIILSKNFGILILVSFVVATPVTWIYLSGWLDGFAYRISLNPLIFIGGGLVTLLIAMLTISYHVVRASLTNPVNSLRYE